MYEECLYYNLNNFTRQLNKVWEDEFAKLGLSPSHGYLLRLILSERGLTQKALAEKMGLTASTVTRFIDGLEQKGLAKRWSSTEDARSLMVAPTKKAEALQDELDQMINGLHRQLAEIVGQNELEMLLDVLQKYRRRFDGLLETSKT